MPFCSGLRGGLRLILPGCPGSLQDRGQFGGVSVQIIVDHDMIEFPGVGNRRLRLGHPLGDGVLGITSSAQPIGQRAGCRGCGRTRGRVMNNFSGPRLSRKLGAAGLASPTHCDRWPILAATSP